MLLLPFEGLATPASFAARTAIEETPPFVQPPPPPPRPLFRGCHRSKRKRIGDDEDGGDEGNGSTSDRFSSDGAASDRPESVYSIANDSVHSVPVFQRVR